MALRMIGYGMTAALVLLLAAAVAEAFTARGGPLPGPDRDDAAEAVWQVLAEARRITQEAL